MAETRAVGYRTMLAAYNAQKTQEAMAQARAELEQEVELQKLYRTTLIDLREDLDKQIIEYEKLIQRAQDARKTGRGEVRDDLINSIIKLKELNLRGQTETLDAQVEIQKQYMDFAEPTQSMVSTAQTVGADLDDITSLSTDPAVVTNSVVENIIQNTEIPRAAASGSRLAATQMAIDTNQTIVSGLLAQGIELTPAQEQRIEDAVWASTGAIEGIRSNEQIRAKTEQDLDRVKGQFRAGVGVRDLETMLTGMLQEEYGMRPELTEEQQFEANKKSFLQEALQDDGRIDQEEARRYAERFMARDTAFMSPGEKAAEGGVQIKRDLELMGDDPEMMRYAALGAKKAERAGVMEQIAETPIPLPTRYEDIRQRAGEILRQTYVEPRVPTSPEVRQAVEARTAPKVAELVATMPDREKELYRAHVRGRRMLEETQGQLPILRGDDDTIFGDAGVFVRQIHTEGVPMSAIDSRVQAMVQNIYGSDATPEQVQDVKQKYYTYTMFLVNRDIQGKQYKKETVAPTGEGLSELQKQQMRRQEFESERELRIQEEKDRRAARREELRAKALEKWLDIRGAEELPEEYEY